MNIFYEPNVYQKLTGIRHACEYLMNGGQLEVPLMPARDIPVLVPELHPDKVGFSYREGQARLLHDLASIELQAMELALRTLAEYPQAPAGFREELFSLILSEAHHLELCLDGLRKLGYAWGFWPIHMVLWSAVSPGDSLLDRILIVHRYLEGSGLDAGDTLLRRLDGVLESAVHPVVRVIATDELGHVQFGSRWYREICRLEKRDAVLDFPERMHSLIDRLPKRVERINQQLRAKAGFTPEEIQFLEDWRARYCLHQRKPKTPHPV